MDNGYCIIMSKYRVYQGILLCRSIVYNQSNSHIYILCIDSEAYEILSKLKMGGVTLIRSNEIEDDMLLAIKNKRLLNEYCWTLKPFFIEHVFACYRDIDNLTYLDADMCFFNDPTDVYKELEESHILLSKHNFPELHKGVADFCGTYNSGFIIFRRSRVSLEALKWWKRQCYQWCFDKAEEGKFGDQKYLDLLSVTVDGAKEIVTPGVNIAPWNEERYAFSIKNGKVYVNNDKLICYHYSGLRIVEDDLFALVIGNKQLNFVIHTPYVFVLRGIIREVNTLFPNLQAYEIEHKFKDNAKYFKAEDLEV